MRFRADITVTLKPVVNDPQGLVVGDALRSLGFSGVERVRVGKAIAVELEAADEATAEEEARLMCQKLLSNPVIEEFSVAVSAAAEAPL